MSNKICAADAIARARLAVDFSTRRTGLQANADAISDLASAQRQLGICYQLANNFDNAEIAFQDAVDGYQVLAADSRQLNDNELLKVQVGFAQALNSLGIYKKIMGEKAEADRLYRQSIDLLQAAIDGHPARIDLKSQLGVTALNLGNLSIAEKDYAQAETWYRRSTDEFRELVSNFPKTYRYHEILLLSINGLGLAQKSQKQFEQARQTLQDGLDLSEETIKQFDATPAIRLNLARICNNLSNLCIDELGDLDAGVAILQRSVDINRQLTDQFPQISSYRYSYSIGLSRLASIVFDRGEHTAGLQLLDTALADGYKVLASNANEPRYRSNVAWALATQCQCFAEIGDDESAFESAAAIAELAPDDDAYWIKSAEALALAAARVDANQVDVANPSANDNQTSVNEPVVAKAVLDGYIAQIAQYLRQADGIQRQDFDSLFSSPAFLPIRDRQEFDGFRID